MSSSAPKACVIGWPISHSRSPLIHGYWLQKYGLAGSYERLPVSPTELKEFFNRIRNGEFIGCNVTLPHKQSALSCVDDVDDRVSRIGALNTVWNSQGRLQATSTDGPGFFQNLKSAVRGFEPKGPIVIFGAGGSARAIADELLRQGATEINVHNRTIDRAFELAKHFGSKIHAVDTEAMKSALQRSHLLINTTSAGIGDTGRLEIRWQDVNPNAIICDINYVPLVTPFLADAKDRGHTIVTGLGMLLHQAVIGFERWFGVRPEVTQELHDLVARDIDPDFAP